MTGHRRKIACDLAMLVLAGATAAAIAAGATGTLRAVLSAVAIGLVPGAAVLTRVQVEDTLNWFGLAVILSIGQVTAATLVTVRAGWWQPDALLAGGGAAAALLLLADMAGAKRGRSATVASPGARRPE